MLDGPPSAELAMPMARLNPMKRRTRVQTRIGNDAEEEDLVVRPLHEVRGHHAEDCARGPQEQLLVVHERDVAQQRSDPAEEIEPRKPVRSPGALESGAEDEERVHVDRERQEVVVHEEICAE